MSEPPTPPPPPTDTPGAVAKPEGEGVVPAEASAEPEEITRAFEQMPPRFRHMFEMMAISMQGGPRVHPLFEKFNEKHIDKFLDHAHEETDKEYRFRSSGRRYQLTFAVLALVALGAIVVYLLPRDPALLKDILQILVAFAGGFGGGYGLKTLRDRDE